MIIGTFCTVSGNLDWYRIFWFHSLPLFTENANDTLRGIFLPRFSHTLNSFLVLCFKLLPCLVLAVTIDRYILYNYVPLPPPPNEMNKERKKKTTLKLVHMNSWFSNSPNISNVPPKLHPERPTFPSSHFPSSSVIQF